MTEAEKKELDKNFTYHAPFGNQPERYNDLRTHSKVLAVQILNQCPPSRERALALTNLEQAMFWANASIARNETPPVDENDTSIT